MPKFEDIIILVAAAGVAVAAGVFWTSRRAAAAGAPAPNRWLAGSNGANAAPAAWSGLPAYVMQDPRADYTIFQPATDIAGNPIDIAHANTEGGFQ